MRRNWRDFLLGSIAGLAFCIGSLAFEKSEIASLIFGFLLAPSILVSLKGGFGDGVSFTLSILYWGTLGALVGNVRRGVLLMVMVSSLGLAETPFMSSAFRREITCSGVLVPFPT